MDRRGRKYTAGVEVRAGGLEDWLLAGSRVQGGTLRTEGQVTERTNQRGAVPGHRRGCYVATPRQGWEAAQPGGVGWNSRDAQRTWSRLGVRSCFGANSSAVGSEQLGFWTGVVGNLRIGLGGLRLGGRGQGSFLL